MWYLAIKRNLGCLNPCLKDAGKLLASVRVAWEHVLMAAATCVLHIAQAQPSLKRVHHALHLFCYSPLGFPPEKDESPIEC